MKINDFSLIIDEVTFSYEKSDQVIVKNISLEISAGSVTSLLGLNGSGKTTLLLIILGYLKPQSGSILFTQNNHKLPIDKLNGLVGYLPQVENIPFDYPVNEFIMLGRSPLLKLFDQPGDLDKKKVNEIQEFLNLKALSDKKLLEISGGELQRVRIARTLSQDPRIILMDEPMTHLDVKHKQYVSGVMKKLAGLGRIVIYSSHDPLDALNNSDHCILLSKNLPALCGDSSEIINSEHLTEFFDMDLKINDHEGKNYISINE